MAGYCTVDDVASAFPQFKRNAPGSIQDSTIEGWIEDEAARIDAVLMARGVTLSDLTSPDQQSFLRGLNRSGGICQLGLALQETATLSPGESALADHHCSQLTDTLDAILDGKYDKILRPDDAVVPNVGPAMAGIGGAETDPTETPPVLGQNRAFWKNQIF